MKYVYPAILTPVEDLRGYYAVEFPDIKAAVTQGKDLFDAIFLAEDLLNFVLMYMEDDKEKIPAPTDLKNVATDDAKSFVVPVIADTENYRNCGGAFFGPEHKHERWYSPNTDTYFYIKSDSDEEICNKVEQLIRKLSGVYNEQAEVRN